MNRSLLSAVALTATLVAAPAMAADFIAPIVDAPAPVAVQYDEAPVYQDAGHDWAGGYAGVIVGHGWGEAEQNDLGAFDASGWLLGGTIGYNFQTDSIVYGVESDLSWSDVAGTSGTQSTDQDWVGTLRGRIGVDLGGVMPYVTGGFALTDLNASDTAVPYAVSEYQAGLTAGAGLEVGLMENISAKAEYSYTDFGGDWDFNSGNGVDVELRTHQIKGGLNFHF